MAALQDYALLELLLAFLPVRGRTQTGAIPRRDTKLLAMKS